MRLVLVLALVLVAGATGCTAKETRRLQEDLVGRWIGDPVAPPPNAWWEKAKFDVSFAPPGVLFGGRDLSVVASTYAGKPLDLRFEGTYEVKSGKRIEVEERNLGGLWDVERVAEDHLRFTRGDMVLALRKRYGS